ncbi:MAG: DUF3795 domain-containing protein [Anaerolineae bacterium]|nr:DUF3795 domain-containing protein [Anaerolineae bacterium]
MRTELVLAGACGLYCGACGIYRMYRDQDVERLQYNAEEVFHCRPEQIRCEGCRGPEEYRWSPRCAIAGCVAERGHTFCFECAQFACEDLAAFSADRLDLPISNLRRMAEVGLEAWLAEQEVRWRCPACHHPVDIYSRACRTCGAELTH